MIDTSFAKTGFRARIQSGVPITRFHVLGERSSGTNFAKRLLGKNSELEPTEALGWKHGFPHAAAIPPDLLVIGMVRSADAWVRSMHAKPWHATPQIQALGFSDFIRHPWETIIDRTRYFRNSASQGVIGQPLQHDRDPITGKCFPNIFSLRTAKLSGLLSYFDRRCSFVLLRMETVSADPERIVHMIHAALRKPVPDEPYKKVVRRLGANFSPTVPERPATPKTLSPSDLAFLRSSVNTFQESALGYVY